MFLILIETSGNQNYIFSSNKLRENIGASELTYRAGTQWVLEAVTTEGGPELWTGNNAKLRTNLLNQSGPIENSDCKIEVIVATSGKALLLVKEKEIGRNIIRQVTKRALEEAPGLDICGVIHELDFSNKKLSEVNREIHQKFETVRSKKPSPLARFLRLPVVDECNTSGLSASELGKVGDNLVPLSSISIVKRDGKTNFAAFQRVQALLEKNPTKSPVRFPRSLKELESIQEREWLSVIHADGNGLGEIILKFDSQLRQEDSIAVQNRSYINKLRRFSLALDVCTENAFITAVESTFVTKETNTKKNVIPLVPLVLGGDDLTVVCDGKKALNFTFKFLQQFEEETKKEHLESIIPKVAEIALGVSRLSACAGIAIIKPSFPFYNAYNLAEELMKSAKTIKKKLQRKKAQTPWPSSALDFHVLYDASASELDFIREGLQVEVPGKNKTKIYGKPYVVTPLEWLEGEASNFKDLQLDKVPIAWLFLRQTDLTNFLAGILLLHWILSKGHAGLEWVKLHYWQELIDRVGALAAVDDDKKRKLPRSQMSDLRSGLFLGKDEANARLKLIWNRYQKLGLNQLITKSFDKPSFLRSGLFLGEKEENEPLDLAWKCYKYLGLCKSEIQSLELPSLFWLEMEDGKDKKEEEKTVWITNFLDAVDAVDFLDTSVDLVTSEENE